MRRVRQSTYEEAISARYAFSFAISGSVFGKVACALAKWEKVAGPADPIFEFGEDEVGFSLVVEEVEVLDLRELRKEPIEVSRRVSKWCICMERKSVGRVARETHLYSML